jgi:hypothetical protein
MADLVPVNLSVEDVHAAAGMGPDAEIPQPPSAEELDNWAQEAYSLDVSAATNLGFPVGNLSAGFRRQALMFGSSRWKDVATKDGHSYRFGVALRAVIVVSDIKGQGALTLPVVAAKVEIEGARATAQLLVRGYKGKQLGEALPAWQSFGVDSYAQYMKSVSEIQKIILEDEGNVESELLATSVSALPSPAICVGTVHALQAIAAGAPLIEAIEKLRTDETAVVRAVRDVYRSRLGVDQDRAKPTAAQKQEAEGHLYSLSVGNGRRGLFGR